MGSVSRGSRRSATELRLAAGAGRLVGLERHYRCPSCSRDHTSWSRLSSCPDCGERLTVAVIRRAAIVPLA